MANEVDRLGAIAAAILILLLLPGATEAAAKPTALVLPLVLSYPNSTRRHPAANHFLRRRHLQKEDSHPNAHMRLHDDLLTNGYYTTRLYIGTPPQAFALIVDSGSTVTYVPCSSCTQCGHHQDPRFQPDLSSTYGPVKCNIDCSCDNEKNQCVYERRYAEMSSSSGVLGEDIISFGKESALKPQRAVFGCENSETGDLFTQHADGIMGLGRGQLSIMDQLVDKGVISDSFSLCYGGMNIGGGAMVLGGISPPSDMVFSHSDPVRSPYYNIELKELHVAGKVLHLDSEIFNRKHGTVLDSGTTYAYLPEQAFVAFKDAITRNLHSLKQIRGPDPSYNDICFAGAGSDVSQLSKAFPKVEMVFGNGQKLSLSPENYLFRHSKVEGAYCLGVFQNGKDPTTLLGGIIVRNTLVIYDRQNERIGFWKTNCSELWERLHTTEVAPSPAPLSSSNTNSTINMAPAFSPSGLLDTVLPERIAIEIIVERSSKKTVTLVTLTYTTLKWGKGSILLSSYRWDYSLVAVVENRYLLPECNNKAENPQLNQEIVTEGAGQLEVGLINFDMLINITYAELAPHITELAELIAHELEIDFDQVHVMNITSKGNYTLIKWAIYPAGSAKFMSNTTAMAIISRLTEHRIHLPDNLGSYELLEWNVEAPSRRIWWHQHFVAVVVGALVVLILSSSAFLVWYIWRNKIRGPGIYRPVGAPLPEQELQPL